MTHGVAAISKEIRRLGLALFFAALILFMAPAALADSLQFNLLPGSGNVSGPAGSTVGWGYSITNQSTSDWLVATNLAADAFLHGTPILLFDFPVIGPGQTATESFNVSTGVGLYELTWDANAPIGYVNSGNFVLSAQWWNGNPSQGGTLITDAPDTSDAYSASVGRSATPEPASLLLWASGFLVIKLLRRFRTRRLGPQPGPRPN